MIKPWIWKECLTDDGINETLSYNAHNVYMMPISSLRRRRRNLCKQIELSSADAIAGMQKCINTWENTLENHWTEKIHFQFNLYTYVGIRRTFLSLFYIVYKKKKKGCINSRIYICYFTTFRIIIATFCVRRAPQKT